MNETAAVEVKSRPLDCAAIFYISLTNSFLDSFSVLGVTENKKAFERTVHEDTVLPSILLFHLMG